MKDISQPPYNLTWENPTIRSEAAYEHLCENSQPSDFYFHVSDDYNEPGFTIISIVPKVFFEKEKCMWDQSMYLKNILPEDFGEEMESVWGCERNIEEVRKDLFARGFEENEEFSKILSASGEVECY